MVEKEKLSFFAVDSPFVAPVVQIGLNAGSNLQNQFGDLKRIVQTVQLTRSRQVQKLNPEAGSHLRQSLVE